MNTKRLFWLKWSATALLAVLIGASPARASLFETNLIVNGDAEAGPASLDGSQVVASIPGWTTNGEFNVVAYNTPGGFPLLTDPGPPNRGTNFFCGGQNDPLSTGTQVLDVSAAAAAIDTGKVPFTLSGYLGGYSSQDDHTVLSVTFSNSVPAGISTVSIGPVLAADRDDLTGLLYRETNSVIPAGTRTILVMLQMTREEGNFNDGYADNLSLVFSPPFAISRNGGSGTVSWVTNASVNHLQSNTNLAQTAGWTAWTGPVAFDGTNFAASFGLTNAQRFFRLTAP